MIVNTLLTLAMAAGLAACSTVPRPTRDIAASIHAGLSDEDHVRVATLYARKAFACDDEAAQHERLARSCSNRTQGDRASLGSLSRLRDQMRAAAEVARTLAAAHRGASGTVHG